MKKLKCSIFCIMLWFVFPTWPLTFFPTKKSRCKNLYTKILDLANNMKPTDQKELYEGNLKGDTKKLDKLYQEWIQRCRYEMQEHMSIEIRHAIKGRIPIRD